MSSHKVKVEYEDYGSIKGECPEYGDTFFIFGSSSAECFNLDCDSRFNIELYASLELVEGDSR